MAKKQKQMSKEKRTRTNKKICFRCKNLIVPTARHVDLITWDNEIAVNKTHFHIQCWGDYNQERVNDRIKEMAGVGLKMIKPMLESSARYNY